MRYTLNKCNAQEAAVNSTLFLHFKTYLYASDWAWCYSLGILGNIQKDAHTPLRHKMPLSVVWPTTAMLLNEGGVQPSQWGMVCEYFRTFPFSSFLITSITKLIQPHDFYYYLNGIDSEALDPHLQITAKHSHTHILPLFLT